MSDFSDYMLAQANKRTAVQAYETASVRLELVMIHERIAELNSQA